MAVVPFGGSGGARGPSGKSGNMPKRVTGSGKLAPSTSSASKKVDPGGSDRNNTPQKVNVTRSGNGRSFNP